MHIDPIKEQKNTIWTSRYHLFFLSEHAGCFNVSTNGTDYNGLAQYTENSFRCLNWANVDSSFLHLTRSTSGITYSLSPYFPTRNLRSSERHLLEVPHLLTHSYGERGRGGAAGGGGGGVKT